MVNPEVVEEVDEMQAFRKRFQFDKDAVFIGYNKETLYLRLETTSIAPDESDEATIKELREQTKEKFSGKEGRKYAIAFYEIGDNNLIVTDFFRACLVDPVFYVKDMCKKNGVLAIAADEFALREVIKSKKWDKESDVGVYGRLMELLNFFWCDVTDLHPQMTEEYFVNNVRK